MSVDWDFATTLEALSSEATLWCCTILSRMMSVVLPYSPVDFSEGWTDLGETCQGLNSIELLVIPTPSSSGSFCKDTIAYMEPDGTSYRCG